MWNAPDKPIPRHQVEEYQLGVLQRAVDQAAEFDPRSFEVYACLNALAGRSLRQGGFTLFRAGLETGDPAKLAAGLKLIRKHLGV